MLVDRGCELVVVPAKTPAREVLKMEPQGVFLSNGPEILSHATMQFRLLKKLWIKISLFLAFVLVTSF